MASLGQVGEVEGWCVSRGVAPALKEGCGLRVARVRSDEDVDVCSIAGSTAGTLDDVVPVAKHTCAACGDEAVEVPEAPEAEVAVDDGVALDTTALARRFSRLAFARCTSISG